MCVMMSAVCALDSYEAADSHAHGAVPVPDQEPEVAVAGHEGVLLHQPVLPAGGVRSLHQRDHAQVYVRRYSYYVCGCLCGKVSSTTTPTSVCVYVCGSV